MTTSHGRRAGIAERRSKMDFKRIVCPVELSSTAHFGIKPAASLATRYGAELLLVNVAEAPPLCTDIIPAVDITPLLQRRRSEILARLWELASKELSPSIAFTCLVRFGVPHREIARVCREKGADLVVLPTQSTSALKQWFLGTTADKIIRSAPCPVLSLPPQDPAAREFQPRKIIFATDFSDFSDQALPWALSISESYGAELLMVHVATVHEADPGNPRWSFPDLPGGFIESVEDSARQELAARVRRVSNDQIAVKTRMLRGIDPAVRIMECAKTERADLVVLATHGRTGFAHVLLGSTAERVVRFASCPVLTVRQPARLAHHVEANEEGCETRPSQVHPKAAEHPTWSVPSPHIAHHP
jgi:nucleotide-binding universal stress UspA family protein